MKKLLCLISLVVILLGCEKNHIYHTYYGDIDVDTILATHEEDGSYFYPVKKNYLDSVTASKMELDAVLEVIFYNPIQDKYFLKWYGSDRGSSARVYFDPYKEEK